MFYKLQLMRLSDCIDHPIASTLYTGGGLLLTRCIDWIGLCALGRLSVVTTPLP